VTILRLRLRILGLVRVMLLFVGLNRNAYRSITIFNIVNVFDVSLLII
jgi:hypothetical protein